MRGLKCSLLAGCILLSACSTPGPRRSALPAVQVTEKHELQMLKRA